MISHRIEKESAKCGRICTNLSEFIEANLDPNADRFSINTPHGEYRIVENNNPKRINRSSYWVIQAPNELIPNHGAVFTTNVVSIATALYRISQSSLTNRGALEIPNESR